MKLGKIGKFHSVKVKIASPEEILEWSHGEVTEPETINYRTQRPEKDGLFCERIFGPTKDYQCYCGKYKGIRYKGIVCDRCGVEVTSSSVRRERMGHINLASPVTHIWFLRAVPSPIGRVLNLSRRELEKIAYFAGYVVTKVFEKERQKARKRIEKEYKEKVKEQNSKIKDKKELERKVKRLKKARDKAKKRLEAIKKFKIMPEVEYRKLALKYGQVFEAGTGAETIRNLLEELDLEKKIKELQSKLKEAPRSQKKRIRRRLKIFKDLKRANIRPEWMCLTVLPVLPPGLRPLVKLDGGRFASSDLNDLYRRVINRNNRLKYLLETSAPEVIIRNEKRMLQEAVDALIDNKKRTGTTVRATTGGRRLLKSLAEILKGKKGRFRRNLLGKRTDYSGRSVIVVGPGLDFDQTGLPKEMALELFKPFIIRKILEKGMAYHVRGATRLIEKRTDEIWALLEEEVKDKLVLLNRAPTLHRLGIQAFYPTLIEGEAIRIHPMICKPFNADFDGDQMAVHLPLSKEAQYEAKNLMLSSKNLLKPATGKPVVSLSQDIILGIYWMTQIVPGTKGEGKYFSDFEEAVLAYEFGDVDLRAEIKVMNFSSTFPKNFSMGQKKESFFETSVGRIIFNDTLPKGFPFINKLVDKRKLGKIVAEIIRNFKPEVVWPVLDGIKNLGFEYSTRSGITWSMGELIVPEKKQEILNRSEKEVKEIESHYRKGLLSAEERRAKVIEVWHKASSELEKLVPKALLKTSSAFVMIDSGARGSWSLARQMAGMKGLVVTPAGRVMELPIKSCFQEGLNILEYFLSTHGARKGLVDTALRTAESGYLTRRLVDVAHGVIIQEKDCGDKEGITIYRKEAELLDQDLAQKIVGRISLDDVKAPKGKNTIVKKGEIIDWKKAEEIEESKIERIRVRSPLSCKSKRGICQKCYGWDLGSNNLVRLGQAVGVVAGQAIGEPGTQLTLRTFHVGGVAGEADITTGLPRVEEIFEDRTPKGKALISKTKGKVISIDEKKRKVRVAKKNETLEYKIPPGREILVTEGQEIEPGEKLCVGNIDLDQLFKVAGEERTKRYIINELQKVYVSQGAIIHDKHLEVIVRQMFSRMKIGKPGDSFFAPGEIVERAKFLEENERLGKKKKKKAKAFTVLSGITKVALTADSFLSAASFQQTSKVLIDAALEGKRDRLRGLKENVIVGKLIPVGTGFEKKS